MCWSTAIRWSTRGAADSWLDLPLIGSFQPSELAKIGLAMASAYVFEWMSTPSRIWKGMAVLAAMYGVPLLLILKQPDFGTAMVIIFMFVCIVFVWGIRWRFVLLGLSALVVAVPLAWFFYFDTFQKNRILTFLYPGHDPAASYNLMQARRAIASGGLAGSLRETPVHVPVKESDFIYTAVSEHMGFIGTTALLSGFFFLTAPCMSVQGSTRTAVLGPDPGRSDRRAGLPLYLESGMCVGCCDHRIPLRFISLGGTAMIVNFFPRCL